MITWKDIISFSVKGNPTPTKRVEKSESEWKEILTPEQFRITRKKGTELPFSGKEFNIINGGYFIDQPTALWWKQLATAVVFGLGIATVLTLVLTPSLLALRVWVSKGAYAGFTRLFRLKSIAR